VGGWGALAGCFRGPRGIGAAAKNTYTKPFPTRSLCCAQFGAADRCPGRWGGRFCAGGTNTHTPPPPPPRAGKTPSPRGSGQSAGLRGGPGGPKPLGLTIRIKCWIRWLGGIRASRQAGNPPLVRAGGGGGPVAIKQILPPNVFSLPRQKNTGKRPMRGAHPNFGSMGLRANWRSGSSRGLHGLRPKNGRARINVGRGRDGGGLPEREKGRAGGGGAGGGGGVGGGGVFWAEKKKRGSRAGACQQFSTVDGGRDPKRLSQLPIKQIPTS